MAILSLADYQNAAKQTIIYAKGTGDGWGADATFYSAVTVPGVTPAAAQPGNTANGIVPTNALTGYPTISSFSGTAYITQVDASLVINPNTTSYVGYRYILADLLWYAGTYAPSANVTLSSQPSFSSRLPGGSYVGTQLWLEGSGISSTSGGSYAITYTNQSGTAGQSTSQSPDQGASNVGLQAILVPLQSGDSGIQLVQSVVGNGVGNRSVNLMILRPLVYGRVTARDANNRRRANGQSSQRKWLDRTFMPQIFSNSALVALIMDENAGATLTTTPLEIAVEIASL